MGDIKRSNMRNTTIMKDSQIKKIIKKNIFKIINNNNNKSQHVA